MTKHYLWVWAGLMILLAATYELAWLKLGSWNIVLSLSIAGLKAALVLWFFMHLKHERALTRLFAASGMVWLSILLAISLSDFLTRNWTEMPGHWPLSQTVKPLEFR